MTMLESCVVCCRLSAPGPGLTSWASSFIRLCPCSMPGDWLFRAHMPMDLRPQIEFQTELDPV